MAGSSPGPLGGPKSEPPGGRSRQPQWMKSADDMGTMVLLLRRKTTNDEADTNAARNEPLPLPNAFIVGASIELAIGSKVEATREGRGTRYLLRTSSKAVFNKLQQITELTDKTQVEIIPHPTLNTVQGTVYDPDTKDMEEKDLLSNLSSQGVQAVRRIKKRVNDVLQNTPLLVLSFHGTVLPQFVYFGLLRIPVKVYYPYPMICFNCGAYGHSKKSCQNCGICLLCSQAHEVAENEKCNNTPHCLHCKQGHAVTSRDCPTYKSEQKIIRIKVDQGISFTEARRIHAEETKKQTYSNVFQERLNHELAIKDQMIATLQKQVATLAKELAELKKALKSRSHSQSQAPANAKPSDTRMPASQPSQAQISSATKCDHKSASSSQQKNARMSRKDKSIISPPAVTSGTNTNVYDFRSRSKSIKRHMEISPTSSNPTGKRFSAQPSDDDPIDLDE